MECVCLNLVTPDLRMKQFSTQHSQVGGGCVVQITYSCPEQVFLYWTCCIQRRSHWLVFRKCSVRKKTVSGWHF